MGGLWMPGRGANWFENLVRFNKTLFYVNKPLSQNVTVWLSSKTGYKNFDKVQQAILFCVDQLNLQTVQNFERNPIAARKGACKTGLQLFVLKLM